MDNDYENVEGPKRVNKPLDIRRALVDYGAKTKYEITVRKGDLIVIDDDCNEDNDSTHIKGRLAMTSRAGSIPSEILSHPLRGFETENGAFTLNMMLKNGIFKMERKNQNGESENGNDPAVGDKGPDFLEEAASLPCSNTTYSQEYDPKAGDEEDESEESDNSFAESDDNENCSNSEVLKESSQIMKQYFQDETIAKLQDDHGNFEKGEYVTIIRSSKEQSNQICSKFVLAEKRKPPNSLGYVPFSMLQPVPNLRDQPWFVGTLSKSACQSLLDSLSNCSEPRFLVRCTKDEGNQFEIIVRNEQSLLKFHRIESTDDKYFYIIKTYHFRTISELIDFHTTCSNTSLRIGIPFIANMANETHEIKSITRSDIHPSNYENAQINGRQDLEPNHFNQPPQENLLKNVSHGRAMCEAEKNSNSLINKVGDKTRNERNNTSINNSLIYEFNKLVLSFNNKEDEFEVPRKNIHEIKIDGITVSEHWSLIKDLLEMQNILSGNKITNSESNVNLRPSSFDDNKRNAKCLNSTITKPAFVTTKNQSFEKSENIMRSKTQIGSDLSTPRMHDSLHIFNSDRSETSNSNSVHGKNVLVNSRILTNITTSQSSDSSVKYERKGLEHSKSFPIEKYKNGNSESLLPKTSLFFQGNQVTESAGMSNSNKNYKRTNIKRNSYYDHNRSSDKITNAFVYEMQSETSARNQNKNFKISLSKSKINSKTTVENENQIKQNYNGANQSSDNLYGSPVIRLHTEKPEQQSGNNEEYDKKDKKSKYFYSGLLTRKKNIDHKTTATKSDSHDPELTASIYQEPESSIKYPDLKSHIYDQNLDDKKGTSWTSSRRTVSLTQIYDAKLKENVSNNNPILKPPLSTKPQGKKQDVKKIISKVVPGNSSKNSETTYVNNWNIQLQDLTCLEVIGSGFYGKVWKGTWKGYRGHVAIKTFNATTMSAELFQSEIEGMMHLRHPHLVKLFGVCASKENPLIVMEFHQFGSFKDYFTNGNIRKLNIPKNGYQVASGMEYLGTKNLIHRDLSAKNVLLDENLNAKIADFGLVRSLNYLNSQIEGDLKRPWKWTAPEALKKCPVWSSASDVWSYGVFLWEIFSDGKVPYPEINSISKLEEYIISAKRLNKPEKCDLLIYNSVILRCWHIAPGDRITFPEIKNILTKVTEESLK